MVSVYISLFHLFALSLRRRVTQSVWGTAASNIGMLLGEEQAFWGCFQPQPTGYTQTTPKNDE